VWFFVIEDSSRQCKDRTIYRQLTELQEYENLRFTNDRRCATRHCCQATQTSKVSLLGVACHALSCFGSRLPRLNKFHRTLASPSTSNPRPLTKTSHCTKLHACLAEHHLQHHNPSLRLPRTRRTIICRRRNPFQQRSESVDCNPQHV
jgi:hypothetical protein